MSNTTNQLVSASGVGTNRLSDWLDADNVFSNLLHFENYYRGEHQANGLTALQLSSLEFKRFWRPINIIPALINEPIGYIKSGTFAIECSNPEVQRWAEAWYKKRFAPAIGKIVRFSSCYKYAFCYLWVDDEGASRGLKLRVVSPIENGKRRARADFGTDDDTELTAIVLEYAHPALGGKVAKQKRMILSAESITEEEMTADQSWVATTPTSIENPWGVLPVTVCENPDGSDLTTIIPLQDDLNVNQYDLRASRSYHGFPMLTSDDPIEGTVGPGKIISGTNINRLEPADLSQLIATQDKIYDQIAMLTSSVTMAQRPGANISGEAIKWLMSSLMVKCQEKADQVAACAAATLTVAARMMATDDGLYMLENPTSADKKPVPQDWFADVEFTVTLKPKSPAEDIATTQALATALGAGMYSQREALVRAGYSRDAAMRIAKERLEEKSSAEAGTADLQDQNGGD